MKELIENIESKLRAANKIKNESLLDGAYKQGKIQGTIDAWEYVVAEYKDKYPKWVRVANVVLHGVIGAFIGFIAGILIGNFE